MNDHAGKGWVMLCLWLWASSWALTLWAASLAGAGELRNEESHGWLSGLAASAEGSAQRHWVGPVTIHQVIQAGAEELEAGIAWAVWSWTERTGMPLTIGADVAQVYDGPSGSIQVVIISDLDMFLRTNSFTVRGSTSSWFYTPSMRMAGAVIYLKASVFKEGLTRCAMQVIVHEIGHAWSISGHSSSRDDVMFASGADDCRYSVSPGDVELAGHDSHSCHAEANLNGDIYIPQVRGHSAELLRSIGFSWKLGNVVALADLPAGDCNAVEIQNDMSLTIHDLRTVGDDYSRADLQSFGADAWVLEYAE